MVEKTRLKLLAIHKLFLILLLLVVSEYSFGQATAPVVSTDSVQFFPAPLGNNSISVTISLTNGTDSSGSITETNVFAVVDTGSTPTIDQVRAGNGSDGNPAEGEGSFSSSNSTASTLVNFNVTGGNSLATTPSNVYIFAQNSSDTSLNTGVIRVEYERTRPTPRITSPQSPATSANSIRVLVDFGEKVFGFEPSFVMGGLSNATLLSNSLVSTSNNGSFEFTLIPITEGTVSLNFNGTSNTVRDQSGNFINGATFTIVYDVTPPTVTIGAPDFTLVSSRRTVSFDVTYMGADNTNLSSGDVVINHTNTGGGTVNVLNGTSSTPKIEISGVTGDGSFTISINPGTSSDVVGNTDTGIGSSASVTVDNTAPRFSSAGAVEANNANVSLTFTEGLYTNNNGTGVVIFADFEVFGFTAGSGSVTQVNIFSITDASGNAPAAGASVLQFNLSLLGSNPAGDETFRIRPRSNAVFDEAGNPMNTTQASTPLTLQDQMPPSGYSVQIDPSIINTTNETSVSFTFTDAEVGATYAYTYTSNNGGTPVTGSGTIVTPTDQITTGNLNLSGLSDGAITLSVTLEDTLGNKGIPVTDTKAKDAGRPTIISTSPVDDATNIIASTDIVIQFSEDIFFATGNLKLINLDKGSTATFNSLPSPVTMIFDGDKFRLNSSVDLEIDNNYAVRIDSFYMIDLNGNFFQGINDNTTLNFRTADPAKLISRTGTANFTSVSTAQTSSPGNLAQSIVFQFTIINPYTSLAGEKISFDEITFSKGSGNTVVDWFEVIQGARLEDSVLSTNFSEDFTITANEIAIKNIPTSLGQIDQGGSKTYNLKIWIRDDIETTNTDVTTLDDLSLQFQLAGDQISWTGTNSLNSLSSATSNVVDIDVEATRLKFLSFDANVIPNSDFNAEVEAVDVNGYRDTDYGNLAGEEVTISLNATTGSPAGTISNGAITPSNGLATFNTLQYDQDNQRITLSADAPQLSTGTSGEIVVNAGSPSVSSFTRKTPNRSTTNADEVTFLVTFSEDVVNVDAADFEVSGTTASISVGSVSTDIYDLVVSGGDLASLNGSVQINLSASASIQDFVGTDITPGEPTTDESYLIDNKQPIVTNLDFNPNTTITNSTIGSPFTISITYDETMDRSSTPVVTFPTTGENPLANTLTFDSNSSDWVSGTTYNAVYTIANADEFIPDIDIKITEAKDIANNVQVEFNSLDAFTVDTKEPKLNSIAIADNSLIVGETTLVTFIFSEPVTSFENTDITFSNGTLTPVTSTDGVTFTATFTPTDDLEDATNIFVVDNTGYTDTRGNVGSGTFPSDNFVIDTKEPTITKAETRDSNEDGQVDQLVVEFSESIVLTDAGTDDYFSLTNSASIILGAYDTSGIQVTFNLLGTPANNTAFTTNPTYKVTNASFLRDALGNEMTDGETITGTDGAAPIIIAAETEDADKNGQIDRIIATFSENIDAATVDDSDFSVTGYTVASASSVADIATVIINESGSSDTDLKPNITLNASGNLADISSNEISRDQTFSGTEDGAEAVLVSAQYRDSTGGLGDTPNGNIDQVLVMFSEDIETNSSFDKADWSFSNNTIKIDSGYFLSSTNDTVYIVLDESSVPPNNTAISNLTLSYQNRGIPNSIRDKANLISGNNLNVEVEDAAPPSITAVRFYDSDKDDGLIDRMVLVFTEDVLAADNSISANEFDGSVVLTLPDGKRARFSTLGSDYSIQQDSVTVKGITGQVDPITSAGSIALTGFTNEFKDSKDNTTTDPDNDFLNDEGFVDKAAPVIASASFFDDSQNDGLIDRVDFRWSEPTLTSDSTFDTTEISRIVLPDGSTANFSNASFVGETTVGMGVETFSITGITGQNTPLTDKSSFALKVTDGTFQDEFGNIANKPNELNEVVDLAAAIFISARFYDTDTDGNIDEIVVEMSEPTDFSRAVATDFAIANFSSDNILNANNVGNGDDATDNDEFLTIKVSGRGTAVNSVEYTKGTLSDLSGNVTVNFTSSDSLLIDEAPPVITKATTTTPDGSYGIGKTIEVTLTISEPVLITRNAANPTKITFDSETQLADANKIGNTTRTTFSDTTLLFTYKIEEGEESTDLSVTDIALNGDSIIVDKSAKANPLLANVTVMNKIGQNLNNNVDIVVDGVRPKINAAYFFDEDHDGSIDELVIEVSEPINETVLQASTIGNFFRTGSGRVNGFKNSNKNPLDGDNDQYFTLDVEITGTDTTSVSYLAGDSILQDMVGNTVNNTNSIALDTLRDRARPVIINSVSLDINQEDGDVDRIELELSEPVQDNVIIQRQPRDNIARFKLKPVSTAFGNTAESFSDFSTEVKLGGASNTNSDDENFSLFFRSSNVPDFGTGPMILSYDSSGSTGTNVRDGSGNVIYVADDFKITDGARPLVKGIMGNNNGSAKLEPKDDSQGINAISEISLTYSEQVSFSGNKQIALVELATIPITKVFDSSNKDSVQSADDGKVTITIPTTASDRSFYVIVEEGAFEDDEGNESVDQFNNRQVWNFSIRKEISVVGTSFERADSSITTILNEEVTQIGTLDKSNFTITDGLGDTIPIPSDNDISPANSTDSLKEITIKNLDFSSAVGDLYVTYYSSAGTTIFQSTNLTPADTLGDLVRVAVDLDAKAPTIDKARESSDSTTILLDIDERVKVVNSAAVLNDFVVTDDASPTPNTFGVVSVDSTSSAGTVQIRLTFAKNTLSPSNIVGDLHVTYTDRGFITDFGSNTLQSKLVDIDLDGESPKLKDISIVASDTISLIFNEKVKLITAIPPGEFEVTDGDSVIYGVTAILEDGNMDDDTLRIRVADLKDAIGSLTIKYNRNQSEITDLAGNPLKTFDTTFNENLNPVPTVTDVNTDKAKLVAGDDPNDDIYLFRTTDSSVASQTPIEIKPLYGSSSTIKIYAAANLSQDTIVYQGTGSSSYKPTLKQLFEDDASTTADDGKTLGDINFSDTLRDNGIFIFYITETSDITFTEEAEGKPDPFTIALLDSVLYTSPRLRILQNAPTDTLSIPDFNSVAFDVVYKGDRLGVFDNPTDSSALFSPAFADTGNFNIDVTISSRTSGASATFEKVLTFSVAPEVQVFKEGANTEFAANKDSIVLELNDKLNSLLINEGLGSTQQTDFVDLEVYRLNANNSIINSIGERGILNPSGGRIGSFSQSKKKEGILKYTDTDTTGALVADSAWQLVPGGLNPTKIRLDTITNLTRLRFALIGKDTVGTFTLDTQDANLYPTPTVKIKELNFDNVSKLYCKDGNPVRLVADINVFPGSNENRDNLSLQRYELYTHKKGGSNYDSLLKSSTSNILDPNSVDAGSYRIIYTTDTLTPAEIVVKDTADFEVEEAQKPDVKGNVTKKNEYELCEGQSLAGLSITIDTASSDTSKNEYTWYSDLSLTDTILQNNNTISLQLLSDSSYIGSSGINTPISGTTEYSIYVTATSNKSIGSTRDSVGCESEATEVTIRVFPKPELEIQYAQNFGNNRTSDNIGSTSFCVNTIEEGSATVKIKGVQNINDLTQKSIKFTVIDSASQDTINIANDIDTTAATLTLDPKAIFKQLKKDTVGGASRKLEVTFEYTSDNANSCTGEITSTFTIHPLPKIAIRDTMRSPANTSKFENLDSTICYGERIAIQGVLIDNNDNETKARENRINFFVVKDPTATFNFSDRQKSADDGGFTLNTENEIIEEDERSKPTWLYIITQYEDGNQCTNQITDSILVNPQPRLNIGALGNEITDSTACLADGSVSNQINARMTVNNFGNFNSATTTPVTFKVDWIVENDTVVKDTTYNTDALKNNMLLNSSGFPILTYTYTVPSTKSNQRSFNFQSIIKNEDTGCSYESGVSTIEFGGLPEPSIAWQGLTAGKPTSFIIEQNNGDLLDSDISIVSYEIKNNKDNTTIKRSRMNQISFPLDTSNWDSLSVNTLVANVKYQITVTIGTNRNCEQSITRSFELLEKVVVDKDNGIEYKFSNGDKQGWKPEVRAAGGFVDLDTTTWLLVNNSTNLGKNDRAIEREDTEGYYWRTVAPRPDTVEVDTSGYIPTIPTYIYSPVFDLTKLERPAVGFDRWFEFADDNDGVVFQYSIDNGQSWKRVGNYTLETGSSGPNMYNFESIASRPGTTALFGTGENSNNVGWAGIDTTWARSENALPDEVKNPNVRFRFALSSRTTGKGGARGFAFDNFEIYELEKNVIVENFSSINSKDSYKINKDLVEAFDASNTTKTLDGEEVLLLNYFVEFSGEDSNDVIYNRNRIVPNARASLYELSEIPELMIGGVDFDGKGNEDDDNRLFAENEAFEFDVFKSRISRAEVGDSEFEIGTISHSVKNTNQYEFKFTITPKDTTRTIEDLGVFIVVVEPEVSLDSLDSDDRGVYNEGDKILNVVQKILPNPGGIYYENSAALKDNPNISVTWEARKSNLSSESNLFGNTIQVIVFIQNLETQEIYQAESSEKIGVTKSIVAGLEDDLGVVSVYPNPTHNDFTVDFADPLSVDTHWTLVDQSGRQVKSGVLVKGTRTQKISTEEISAGIYLLHIPGKGNASSITKILLVR